MVVYDILSKEFLDEEEGAATQTFLCIIKGIQCVVAYTSEERSDNGLAFLIRRVPFIVVQNNVKGMCHFFFWLFYRIPSVEQFTY